MPDWLAATRQIEALEDLALDPLLVSQLEAQRHAPAPIRFHVPGFKSCNLDSVAGCGKESWPAISITGGDCKLQCDHCKGKILAPMIPARTAEDLWRIVNEKIALGASGMLLTGGSNHRNEVEYDPYYPTLRRIKNAFPRFRIALHTALVGRVTAQRMEDAGIDTAMMDVIGAQDTITQVYHLKRRVDDFERTLETLTASRMQVVPHIVIGLHYGKMLGEWNALALLQRHPPSAVVLVVAMPFYAPPQRPFATPDSRAVGYFFREARRALPGIPLLLGCARPPGRAKLEIESYAIMAGLDGLAHPSEGMLELASTLGRAMRISPACCSIASEFSIFNPKKSI
ncbi:MAG: radical SAM protein [Sulfurimicrobium sp.]|nr:radical SAM protein [Sulfurimicrobium sp.]